ncbi:MULTISPECIES: Pr6Pr family membrane protein [Pseudomonas]|jgi:hypothetical protein|uniref:Pr6Pr family membrane protein n=1 Tax=Pseudomonas TaxID=286 RepID=UPI0013A0A8AB|nr:hypothetical protein GZ982_04035 [Pseudomonas fluorescens]BBH32562.1 hypothetical protein PBDP_2099 [Pseudomonas sp. St290]
MRQHSRVACFRVEWRDVWPWLIYPLVYFIYALVRGHFIGSYPYPFIEVDTLGYPRVFINAVMVLLGFMGVSLVLVALDRWKGKRWGATAAVRPVTHRSGRVTLDVPRIG